MNGDHHLSWTSFLADVEPTHRISSGNRITHLRDDDRAVGSIWKAIEEAEDRVWVNMYILAPDSVGLGTIERLAEASTRGCDVRLLYDYVGSIRLRESQLEPLEAAGGRHAAFNRCWPPWKRTGPLRIRNHRKLVIVDGAAALCGGLNLSEEYAESFGDEWLFDDTVVTIEGPAVMDLSDVFRQTWQEVTREAIDRHAPPKPFAEGVQVQVLETDPRRPQTSLRAMLDGAISRGRERVSIATPYFLPADWLIESLLAAAERGADVRIVTAGRIDLPPVRGAARHAYGPLLEAGVRIYELYGRILHSKIVTINGAFGTIGSYNLDRWTARHTLDVSVAIVSESIARSLEEEIDLFAADSTEFTLADYERRGLPTRMLHRAASKIVRVL